MATSAAGAGETSEAHGSRSRRLNLGRGWRTCETSNFRVHASCSSSSVRLAQQVAGELEAARTELREKWLDGAADVAWSPRCEVVLHASMRSYVAHVGPGSERTRGSTLIRLGASGVALRRIDLFADPNRGLPETLSHELTHVVLAERFHRRRLPRWADEGIAIVADTPSKQTRYLKDAQDLRRGETLEDLLTRTNYPSPDRMSAFYGRSLSLVNYLLEIGSPAQLMSFVERAMDDGYDAALDAAYGIGGLAELESMWSQFIADADSRPTVAAHVAIHRRVAQAD